MCPSNRKKSSIKPVVVAVSFACLPSLVWAQSLPGAESADAGGPLDEFGTVDDEIVVSANGREYGAVIGDAKPELRFNVGDIMSFGVSSIGELLEELNPQIDGGTESPVFLLNGKRLKNVGEIRRYPARAILRVDVFTPDVAVRYGYAPTQRVINIVLRPRFRENAVEVTGTTSDQFDYGSQGVSASTLQINRDKRTFISAGYSRSDRLLASKRLNNGRYGRQPFSLQGNIGPAEGHAEIDPALSGLVGAPVEIAALPEWDGAFSLEDFARTANQPSLTDLNDYRTLMPSSRTLEGAASVTGKLGEDINATASLNLSQTRRTNLMGLAGSALSIAAANPYSPFNDDVTLYQYIGNSPLERRSKSTNVEATTTANGTHAGWNWDFEAGLTYGRQNLRADRGLDDDLLAEEIDAGALNPFNLAAEDLSRFAAYDRSLETSRVLQASMLGSRIIGRTEAGEISTSLNLEVQHQRLKNEVTEGAQEMSRTGDYFNTSGTASFSIPLLSADKDLGSPIGGVTLSPYVGFDTSGKFGTRMSWGAGVLWSPHGNVQLTVNYSDDAVFPSMSNLYGIEFRLPGELVYDPVLGQMVSATEISGGNADLRAGRQKMLKANLSVRPITGKSYTFTASFTRASLHNGVTRFPDPTAELEAQFPSRFIRDENGTLLAFDSRPVNAYRNTQTRLRFGINASWRVTEEGITADTGRGGPPGGFRGAGGPGGPGARGGGEMQSRAEAMGQPRSGEAGAGGPPPMMGADGAPNIPGMGPRRTPPGRIRFGLYYNWNLEQDLQLYKGGQTLDLLNGEGAGARSGQSPHVIDLQLGYSRAGAGVSLKGSWHSSQTINRDLATGRFAKVESYYSLDLRLFKNFNPRDWKDTILSGVMLSLEAKNLTDASPKIIGSNGYVTNEESAERYIGRTFMAKARKAF